MQAGFIKPVLKALVNSFQALLSNPTCAATAREDVDLACAACVATTAAAAE